MQSTTTLHNYGKGVLSHWRWSLTARYPALGYWNIDTYIHTHTLPTSSSFCSEAETGEQTSWYEAEQQDYATNSTYWDEKDLGRKCGSGRLKGGWTSLTSWSGRTTGVTGVKYCNWYAWRVGTIVACWTGLTRCRSLFHRITVCRTGLRRWEE